MARPARCPCGYDLRGIESPRCPECGAAVVWCALRLFDFASFREAAMALEDGGVEARLGSTGEGASVVHGLGGGPTIYEISVAQLDLQRAADILAPLGIAVHLPIVDRAEPWCPACGERLTEDAACRGCLSAYAWVDSGDAGAPHASPPPREAPSRFPWLLFVTGLAAFLLTPALWSLLSVRPGARAIVPLLAWIVLYGGARALRHGRRS